MALALAAILGLLAGTAVVWSMRRDNARRRATEQALLNSDEKYRQLIQGVLDYAIVLLRPHGEIVSWNIGAERMTGVTAQEAAGQNFSRFFPTGDNEEGNLEKLLRVAATRGSCEDQSVCVRKDG